MFKDWCVRRPSKVFQLAEEEEKEERRRRRWRPPQRRHGQPSPPQREGTTTNVSSFSDNLLLWNQSPSSMSFSKSSSRDLFSLLFSWVLIISDRIFLVDICAVSLSTYIWVPERNIFNMNVASMFTYIINSRPDDQVKVADQYPHQYWLSNQMMILSLRLKELNVSDENTAIGLRRCDGPLWWSAGRQTQTTIFTPHEKRS